jgi:hypothetical protein
MLTLEVLKESIEITETTVEYPVKGCGVKVKLNTGNETVPSNIRNAKKYEIGGDNWFSKISKSDYKTIAIDEKKYELLRFWLLGTWMAKQQDLDFYLINLVLSEREKNLELSENCQYERIDPSLTFSPLRKRGVRGDFIKYGVTHNFDYSIIYFE